MRERWTNGGTGKEKKGGLVLFITDEYGSTLIFENKVAKESTQKVPGQLTAPAETMKDCETRPQAIRRTIREEVGNVAADIKPLFRGAVLFETPLLSMSLFCYEINTPRNSVKVDPEDKHELGISEWVPLCEIDKSEIQLGQFVVPKYRTPIPDLAQFVLSARRGERFPSVLTVSSCLPPELFLGLEIDQAPQPIAR